MQPFLYKINSHGKFEVLVKPIANKFKDDFIFADDSKKIFNISGAIFLGKKNLQKSLVNFDNNGHNIINSIKSKLCQLRGSFNGIYHNKKTKQTFAFTSHIGDRQVFYYSNNDIILISNSIEQITGYLSTNNVCYSIDEKGAYFLLTHGYMLEDFTLCKQIKRLTAGNLLQIEGKKINIASYHVFENTVNNRLTDEAQLIEGINYYFRQAIKRQFDKDLEYKFKHAVSLSGGLDSRMTSLVANEMGYTNQLNITFSQSNYLDETIAQEISSDLKHDFIFKALDNGLFMKNIDKMTNISFGHGLYSGLAHSESILSMLNWKSLGLFHTGQLGDIILGTYSNKNFHSKMKLLDGSNSTFLKNKIHSSWIKNNYVNQEIFKLYNRGFNGINQGLLVGQKYTETFSPFCDVDFLEFAYSIPIELRYKHKIYIKWMKKHYPKSCIYRWEKTKNYPGKKRHSFNDLRKLYSKYEIFGIYLNSILKRLLNKRFKWNKTTDILNTLNHMNPLQYYYENNLDIKKIFDKQFNERLDLLDFSSELKKDVISMFNKGKVTEKMMVLTLLSSLNKIYKN